MYPPTMRAAKVPYLIAALRRTYGARVARMVITKRTRVRLLGGSWVTLEEYCRYLWYFDVSKKFTGTSGRIER